MFFSIVFACAVFSGIGLLAMVFYRAWEIKSGKMFVPLKQESKPFPTSEFLSFVVLCEKQYIPRVFKFIFRHGKWATAHVSRISIENPLTEKMMSIIEVVRGKALITKRESTSLFLKAIAEHKEKMRNGK